MRALVLVAGATLSISACSSGGTDEDANAVDTLAVNNLVVDEGAAMTANVDANAMTTDLNATETNDLVNQDLTTNSPDSNLANGL